MAKKIDKLQPDAWDKTLADKFDELEKRATAPYDGVLGSSPDWVPQHFQIEFEETRNILLNSLTHAEILEYLKRFDNFFESHYDGRELFPVQFTPGIGKLHHYRKAILLGKIEGLRFLVGDNAAKGARFSTGGESKKGKEYEPKASIRYICCRINSHEFVNVLVVLKDADKCADYFESTIDPIGVLFSAVDDDKETISYQLRGARADDAKQFSYKRLRGILTEIKK